jgi:hypothetical protein
MNDDFLYNNRPPVRKAFAQELKQRLNKNYPFHGRTRRWTYPINLRWSWGMTLLAFLLISSALLVFSSEVRADVVNWIQSIAGFQVEHRDTPPSIGQGEMPSSLNGQNDNHDNTPAADASPTATITKAAPTEYFVPTIAPETLLQNMPFEFELPRYVPEGFVLNDSAAFANSSDWVLLMWSKNNAEITMLVERRYTGYYLPAGPDNAEEVQVNRQPALLIRGWWNSEHNWDLTRKLELHWQHNDRYYRLIYTQRSVTRWEIEPISTDIQSVMDDLIRMAESIP